MTVTPTQNKRNARGSRRGRRMTARMRAFRRRAAAWRRRARRAALMAMLAAGLSGSAAVAQAQIGGMGQGAMAPGGGVLNRAVARLSDVNQNGPGWMYFGINPADRGLGYNGGYMTLGGFIPYAEDDLGGFWAADLRGHLSEYGGFFSNVGAVRKQFIGGTLLGVGVYWDYDGDQNQYPTGGLPGTEQYGQFGHSYNQVGVSGEWLTDYGNLRSNGYIPVGSTAYTVGNPGVPFFQNYIMCQNGLDAALGGADLEVGAYVPALADWAGMISVGGYALGNTRYDWSSGPLAGQGVVPWFGGVYTRLDMTFLENWDFSIQYNNDSYFDSTGFIRLTYRMGGSRRRNVPDQVEQPMWRNEHIVRAHQTPVVVQNPQAGNANWNVIHVNNAAAAGGNGTFEAPFRTLAEADAAAVNPWDIVYVNEGLSTTSSSGLYGGTFSFNAMNQSLVGSGGNFVIASQPNCGVNGLYTIAAQTAANPVLSNPGGVSIEIGNATSPPLPTPPASPDTPGATIANLTINGSGTGISAAGNLTANPLLSPPTRAGTTANPLGTTPNGATVVNNVTIAGDGTGATQRGVVLAAATGAIEFRDTAIANMNAIGFRVTGGDADINYFGSISMDSANTINPSSLIAIRDRTGGDINLAFGGTPTGSLVPNEISDSGGQGIFIDNNAAGTAIKIDNVSLTNSLNTSILVNNDNSATTISAGSGSGISKNTAGAAIAIEAGAPTFVYRGPINNAPASGTGYLLQAIDITGGSVTVGDGVSQLSDSGNGIYVTNLSGGTISVRGATLAGNATATQAILVSNSTGTFNFTDIDITGGTNYGVLLTDLIGTTQFADLNVNLGNANAIGFAASNADTVNAISTNTITTASTTRPAISIFEDTVSPGSTTLNLNFTNVASQNAAVTGTDRAMSLSEVGATGAINVSGAFNVGATTGNGTNVFNASGVTVDVNGVQISP